MCFRASREHYYRELKFFVILAFSGIAGNVNLGPWPLPSLQPPFLFIFPPLRSRTPKIELGTCGSTWIGII